MRGCTSGWRTYSYAQAQEATRTGMPIVRPLFLVDPKAPAAWTNWWTYLYGPDLLVSPIWEKDKRTQEVYLPSGTRWRDAWHPDKVYRAARPSPCRRNCTRSRYSSATVRVSIWAI